MDGCDFFHLEHIADEEGDDEEQNADEDGPCRKELFLRGIALCIKEKQLADYSQNGSSRCPDSNRLAYATLFQLGLLFVPSLPLSSSALPVKRTCQPPGVPVVMLRAIRTKQAQAHLGQLCSTHGAVSVAFGPSIDRAVVVFRVARGCRGARAGASPARQGDHGRGVQGGRVQQSRTLFLSTG